MYNIPRRFAGIKRFEHILHVLTSHGLGYVLEKVHLKKRSLISKKTVSRPVELRVMFEELGGSFIKLGQFLSLRPDLIPKEYCDELSKLQDSVPAFAHAEVEHIICQELRKPVSKLFKSFEKHPLAAASIGQVHLAVLKNNKKVAVKVMRPGIRDLFETDLEILDYLARLIKHHLSPELFDPEEIFGEFRRYTENELIYLKEAKNIKTFYENFKGYKGVSIPKVYEELSTSKVLTMDFIEGIELRKVIMEPGRYKKIDSKELSRMLFQSFMKQIFVDGFFHGDPHPGNLVVTKTGIGFLDFGIVGRVDNDMKKKLGSMLIALINRDTDGIVEVLMSLNLVDSDVDVNGLKRDLSDSLGEFYDAPLDKIDIIELFFRSINLARKYKIKLSRDYVLLGKALITLRGVCESLNPSFNIVQETRPFIEKMLADKKRPAAILSRLIAESERFHDFIQGFPEQSRRVYRVINKADLALDSINADLSKLTTEMRVESWRLVLGIIIASLIVSSSLTYQAEPALSRLFVVTAGLMLVYLLFSVFRDMLKKKDPAG